MHSYNDLSPIVAVNHADAVCRPKPFLTGKPASRKHCSEPADGDSSGNAGADFNRFMGRYKHRIIYTGAEIVAFSFFRRTFMVRSSFRLKHDDAGIDFLYHTF